MTPDQVQQMIDLSLKKSFTAKRVGDTPTDALQLTNKRYVDGRVTGGFIIAGGTAGSPFPSGWSVSKIGTGQVRVTRLVDPFVLAKYAAVVTPFSATAVFATTNNHSSSSFDINTFDSTGAAADASVYFVVSAVY